jgi:hypothetical protein
MVPTLGNSTVRQKSQAAIDQFTCQQASPHLEKQKATDPVADHDQKKMKTHKFRKLLKAPDHTSHLSLMDELFWYQEFRAGIPSDSFILVMVKHSK